MAKRVKAPAVTVPVPQSEAEMVEAVAAIGRHQRARQQLASRMTEFIERLKKRYGDAAQPHVNEISILSQGVQIWCEANRAALTDGGKRKTAFLRTGEIRWRMTPCKVNVRGTEAVMALLKAKGLERFIRTTEEIDKEAILKEPAAIDDVAGISIGQHEEFVIVPAETQLEAVR
jgi:phage host-nuclease inhibitor protein Gam